LFKLAKIAQLVEQSVYIYLRVPSSNSHISYKA